MTDDVIRWHLSGHDDAGQPFVAGVYPLLQDETCFFLAVDFDKAGWREDATAFLDVARRLTLPAALERSRSGRGAHPSDQHPLAGPAQWLRGTRVMTRSSVPDVIKWTRSCLAVVAAIALIVAGRTQAAAFYVIFPGKQWTRPDPRVAGLDLQRVDALRATLGRGQSTGMMIVVSGRVVFEYGKTDEVSYIASARKSIISMLFGKYVANGTIPLDKSLRALRLDDQGGLLAAELDATVGDLLTARSGVYHPAANLGDASNRAPARGSVKHGSYFLYNNWDFNALGAILERETGRSVYDIFSTDIAAPIELQDWNSSPGAYADAIRNDTGLSTWPAHHFLLSTRDMARVGYLMLRKGAWNGRQVIPAPWVERSTRVVTSAREVARTSPFIAGLGYGYLWWIFDPAVYQRTPLEGAYTASGAFGQYITVVPRLDMIVAHKTATPPPRNVTNETYFGTILPQAVALVDTRHR